MPTTYNPNYENSFPWCSPDPKDVYAAVCKWCNKKIKINTMGRVALLSHEKSKAHHHQVLVRKTNLPISHFLPNQIVGNNLLSSSPSLSSISTAMATQISASDSSTNTDNQHSKASNVLNRFMLNEQVTSAEIVWALETIATHNSYRSAGANTNLFKTMFPDSQIAAKLEMGRTKLAYLITFGLAPYFTNEIFKQLDVCSEIVIGFDETLNKVSQRQQMDVSVRFWNENKEQVECRYIGSAFLDSSRAVDLLNGLKQCTERKPALLNNVIQLSMDGPNVNWRLMKDLCEELRNLRGVPSFDLLNIGSCGLHAIHNAFKNGMKHTEWNIDEFLTSLYYLFKDFPLRRADYKETTGSNLFPLKFCPIRWIENLNVAERASKMIPYLKVYVAAVKNQRDKKLKEGHHSFKRSFAAVAQSRPFAVIEKTISDEMLSPKLAFFISSAGCVEPFLREFQCDAPMAPFLFDELTSITHSIMSKVLKSECLNVKAKAITNIELKDNNTLPTSQVDIGFGVKAAIKTIMTSGKISEKVILQFKNDCKAYYIAFLTKICDRSPLSHSFTRYISCINPETITKSLDIALKRLEYCLDYMVQRDHLGGNVADKVRQEFTNAVEISSIKSSLAAYKRHECRLDNFWFKVLADSRKEFSNLRIFLKKILILSHGNATLERGFSINKECLIVNLIDESLVAQRIVYDAILNAGGVLGVDINKSLIQYARNAHGRYVESLEQKKKERAQKDDASARKKTTNQALKELELVKSKILADAQKEVALIEEKMSNLNK
ncbi:uncharacterized protein LOC121595491 [Anopheles merus]|uniref:uncharacterized protein LOC121595491 n=1 Tax=Anopheles merus TaxID=30066 RepID=UPI001BE430F9|nr:uncharacterized protein LOC121595491 [Anopheles merus]XP_041775450.1 uncharacterized protein LOC121595491 [Anopheles merus]